MGCGIGETYAALNIEEDNSKILIGIDNDFNSLNQGKSTIIKLIFYMNKMKNYL